MPTKVEHTRELDLETLNDTSQVFDLGKHDLLRIQAVKASGTWGAGEIVVETSLSGGSDASEWDELKDVGEGPDALTSAQDKKILGPYFLEVVKAVRLRVSVANVGACTVVVYIGGGSTGPNAAIQKKP